MVGVAALCLVVGVQGRSSSFVSDMYYDSARKLLVWGEITTHPELKGRDYWEYNFCFMQDGKSGRVRVQYPPYVIVDEKRFVTHRDYAAMVEATTGKVTYLGRVPVRASSGRHLFFEGRMLSTDRENRKTSIAMRDLKEEGTVGKVVVDDITRPEGTWWIEQIAAANDGRTIAWSFLNRENERELHWSYRGTRHKSDFAFSSFAVSSSGDTIFMLANASRIVIVYDAKSGECLGKQVLSREPLVAFCADESSENLVLMTGENRDIKLIGREGEAERN